jgi:hypothetical protein
MSCGCRRGKRRKLLHLAVKFQMNLHMCVRLGNYATSANSGFLGLPFVLLAAGDSE